MEVGGKRDGKRRVLTLTSWYLGTPGGGDRREVPKEGSDILYYCL